MPRFTRALGVIAGSATFVMMLACGAGSVDTPEKVGDIAAAADGSASPAAESAVKEFKVGDVVKLGDWQVTVHKVTDPLKANGFMKPQSGNRFVRVELSVKNLGDRPETFSTLLGLEVQDSADRTYNITLTGIDGADLDGEVAPGKARRGVADFEVAKDSKALVLGFKGDLFGTGTAYIKLG